MMAIRHMLKRLEMSALSRCFIYLGVDLLWLGIGLVSWNSKGLGRFADLAAYFWMMPPLFFPGAASWVGCLREVLGCYGRGVGRLLGRTLVAIYFLALVWSVFSLASSPSDRGWEIDGGIVLSLVANAGLAIYLVTAFSNSRQEANQLRFSAEQDQFRISKKA